MTMTIRQEMSDGGLVNSTFPLNALVPKSETGVVNFLQKYPDFDGRDVTIAIFDSGVDPRAAGLECLCDGKTAKVIERFDCTGCGDVEMTKKVTANEKGYITGLSGRQLKLTSKMLNENLAKREFRIGLKTFFDICPSKVRESQLKAIKSKKWDGPHKTAIANLQRKLNEFEGQYTDLKTLNWDKKLIKDDLDGRMDMLNNYEKLYGDIKTTYDCILYATKTGWQAVIDITEKGDLENALHIGEYSKTGDIKNIDDYISISINVNDDGNILEIVGMCSPHGTHVAAIASGNNENKDLNGVAPNAKIVSMTIGDGRLGSMETGTGLVRAIIKVMEMCRNGPKIDVINMSYGEHSHWSNAGRIGELISEVVNKYGVVWVVSAGNHGPALSTVGAPPDLPTLSCIGVGAYVSPQMMEAEYAMREKLPGNIYTWSSRDPCIDGGYGITVCAPGGAITSVPQFTMTKSQLMNGTSMAAPHVAGAIALLISALKQRNIPYTPFSIKRAICATATKLDYVDPFAQGSGLLNVEKAYEHLIQHCNALDNMIRFSIRCGKSAKGIHIRQGVLKKPIECSVNIEPIFFNHTEAAPKDKLNFNVRLNLVPSQPFVQCGTFLDLNYCTRSVNVKVDPSGLPPGVHAAVIKAFDTDCVEKGPLFEIPVTVIQPHTIENSCIYIPSNGLQQMTGVTVALMDGINGNGVGSFEFQPGTIKRDFILVPTGATWAVLRMRSTDKIFGKDVGKFYIHTLQLLPKSSCIAMETMKLVTVNCDNETTLYFKCQENNILELCIAKYWSNFGSVHLKYNLEFHGIQPITTNAYMMHAGCGIHKMEIVTLQQQEELQPQLQFKTAAVVLKPHETKIQPLSAKRDVIPDGRQIYQNVLTYNLNVVRSADISVYAPIFNPVLYESEFESQLWMIFDINKAMIACGDANSHTFYTKLEKGEYTIRLQIRHEKRDALEKIGEANMLAIYKLSSSINVEFFEEYNQCIVGGPKIMNSIIQRNIPKVFYIAPISQEKLTKANLPPHCAWLNGTITWSKDDLAKKADVRDFTYILNPPDTHVKRNGSSSNTTNGAATINTTMNTNTNSKGISGIADTQNLNNINMAMKQSNTTYATTTTSTQTTSTVNSIAMDTLNPPAVISNAGDNTSVATATSSPASSALATMTSHKKCTIDEYAESLRDFQCSIITKLDYEKAEKIYKIIIAAYPKHLVAHLLLIQNIEASLLSLLTKTTTSSASLSSATGTASPSASASASATATATATASASASLSTAISLSTNELKAIQYPLTFAKCMKKCFNAPNKNDDNNIGTIPTINDNVTATVTGTTGATNASVIPTNIISDDDTTTKTATAAAAATPIATTATPIATTTTAAITVNTLSASSADENLIYNESAASLAISMAKIVLQDDSNDEDDNYNDNTNNNNNNNYNNYNTEINDKQKIIRSKTTTIVRLADHVIKGTDKDALLAYYGLKCDTRPDANKIRLNMDKQRNNLLEALCKKGIAIAKLATIENNLDEHLDELDNIYMEIIKFVDANDSKVIQYSLWHAYAHGHYGRMYKYLQKQFDEKRNHREYIEELTLIAAAMNYQHLKVALERITVSAFPQTFRLF